jgi:hypothetical protein
VLRGKSSGYQIRDTMNIRGDFLNAISAEMKIQLRRLDPQDMNITPGYLFKIA